MSCIFCKNFDFGSICAEVEFGPDYIHTNIVHAGGSSRFPRDEQFNFCPICGQDLRINFKGEENK